MYFIYYIYAISNWLLFLWRTQANTMNKEYRPKAIYNTYIAKPKISGLSGVANLVAFLASTQLLIQVDNKSMKERTTSYKQRRLS